MTEGKEDKLASWARFLTALGSFSTRVVWTLVGLIILAALGRYFWFSGSVQDPSPPARRTEAPVVKPIAWGEVDREIARAVESARQRADAYAEGEVAVWMDELGQRIDDDFLNWYFSYWQQQWLGLKAMGYWLADRQAVERVIGEQPSVFERITEEIQEEFSQRVLRPRVAQLRMERIADATVRLFVDELGRLLAAIPEKYTIPRADWHRYLEDIALITEEAEGNREVSLTLKTVAVSGAAGTGLAAAKASQLLKPLTAKIGTKMSTKAAAKGAGTAAAQLAAKTGAKVGAKFGGKFAGAIVGVGVIIWDVWDHRQTREVEKPLLRDNLLEYLDELQYTLLREPETGLMTIIHRLEENMAASLDRRREIKEERRAPGS